MPLDLAALTGKTATVHVEFMGETAKITYDPSLLTQANLQKADETDEAFIQFFCDMVKSWDVTQGKRKVPLTPKGVEVVPLVFLRAVFFKVMRDAGEGETGKASSGG